MNELARFALIAGAMIATAMSAASAATSSVSQCSLTGGVTPSGLVAVIPPAQGGRSLDLRALSNPYVSGIAVQVDWRDLEPVEGQPNWSNLDHLFAAAQASGKWVQLLVFPGFFSPPWALNGAQSDTFAIQYGPGAGQMASLPMPWDSVYLSRWFEFLRLLSQRYGSSPAFRVVAADGPTSVSAEMTLPQRVADVRQWRADGYTPDKYLGAWHKVLNYYATTFPSQCVSLSAPNLPILERRGGGPSGPEHAAARQSIVEQASSILGSRLVLQWSDLHAGRAAVEAPDELLFILGYNGRIITGLQMRTSAEGSSDVMGAAGDPPLALRRSIDLGMRPNASGKIVNYLEIYQPDVVAGEMQPDLQYAASLFAARQKE